MAEQAARSAHRENAGPGVARRVRTVIGWTVVIAVVVVWAIAFRPQRLGGPADYVAVVGISMTPTMHNGDLAVVEQQSNYHRGDIIAYRVPAGEPGAGTHVIHRIVGGNGTTGFVTRGDHNPYNDPLWHPKTRDVIGRVWFHVPHVMDFIAWRRGPGGLAVIVAVVTFLLIAWPAKRPDTDPPTLQWSAPADQLPES